MGVKLKKIKEDPGKMPRVPTYLKFDPNRTGQESEGWYAVGINSKGIEVLPMTTICHGTDDIAFNECKKACWGHNIYLGMTSQEIATLWGQRRISTPRNAAETI